MKIKNYSSAKQFLYKQIPGDIKQIFTAGKGLKRTKYFLKLLDEPQNKLKVVHVAGTSGKGSTAYLTSLTLRTLGFKVGLTISPHLDDLRERIQIDDRMLSKQKFASYLSKLIPYIDKVRATPFGPPTYFEILTCLAFYTFWKEKVDYAIVETGLGGLYDATNAVDHKDKVVVITKLGLDHTWILGKTLAKIASQKAGIIQKNNAVISLWQKSSAGKVINEISRQKAARVFFLKKGVKDLSISTPSLAAGFSNVKVTPKKTVFDFCAANLQTSSIELSLVGLHQAENCSLALATILFLSKRDGFEFDCQKIRKVLKKAYFPGRLEIMKVKDKTLIIDGAHNPQKMAALVKTLKKIWPEKKFDFLVAFKKGKDYFKMLKCVVPLVQRIVLTSFSTSDQDLIHRSERSERLEALLEKLNFKDYKVIAVPEKALKVALSLSSNHLVITGSLYLISQIYPLLS